jgi:hypothetical protein
MAKKTSFDTSFDFGANRKKPATAFRGRSRATAPRGRSGKAKASAFRKGGGS